MNYPDQLITNTQEAGCLADTHVCVLIHHKRRLQGRILRTIKFFKEEQQNCLARMLNKKISRRKLL